MRGSVCKTTRPPDSRRRWLVAVGVCLLMPSAIAAAAGPHRKSDIGYINPEVPDVRAPAYRGHSYEVSAPDTLDLQEMAVRAVHGMTSCTDPENDYEIYWKVVLTGNPPTMVHEESDVVQCKFVEALPLLRLASGSRQNPEVEQRWMEIMLQMQGPDGLLYVPLKGRPWSASLYGAMPEGDQYCLPFACGRYLSAMTVYARLTGDELWIRAGRRLVDGLNKLAVHEGEKSHFAWHQYGVGGVYPQGRDPAEAIHNPATYKAWVIQGLANYYRHTGYAPARDLAGRLFRWVRDDSRHFAADGEFLPEFPGKGIHFHGHTMVLLGVLDYGLAANDPEAVAFARRGFEYALTQGDTMLGYFPEWLPAPAAELCCTADMIALALKLSESGNGDYWDLADRWLRNLFAEAQLTEAKWGPPQIAKQPAARAWPYSTTDRVIERNLGLFAGWLLPNDFLGGGWGMMHCCGGNGVRAIYYAWDRVLSWRDGVLTVNLLLNRASPWADVESHIPNAGRVDVRLKETALVKVRIPEWVTPDQVAAQVEGRDRGLTWEGRYAVAGEVQAGQVLSLTFPIAEREEPLFDGAYRATFRGNTCVAIEPPGANSPLFQRQHYRTAESTWRKTWRFVAEETLPW